MKLNTVRAVGQYRKKVELIFEDGKSWKVLPEIAGDFGLCAGMDISEPLAAQIRQANEKAEARARAVRIVSASGVSKKELQRRLEHKGESRENAQEAVAWLDEMRLLDDEQLAGQIVKKEAAKGYGRARIQNALRQKGIPREFWDAALSQLPEMDEAIDRFLASRLKGRQPDAAERKKLADALARRGHSWGDIQRALSRYQQEAESAWEDEL